MRIAVAMCLVVALLTTACGAVGGSEDVGAVTSGTVEQRMDGRWAEVTRVTADLPLRAVTDAVLDVDGTVVRLRGATEAVLADDRVLDVAVGDVLVEGDALAVEVGDATITGTGATRVQAGVSPRVAVYSGGAQVSRPGERQPVNALRQLDLSARRLDGTDEPLAYAADDPFDQRMVPQAIAFDDQVQRLVTAIDATYGAAPQPAAFYTSFVSVAEPDVPALTLTAPRVGPDGAVGPPADALVGLFMARAAADVAGVEPLDAATRIADLRGEGARWGLVSLALGVSGVTFAGIVDDAVARREEVAPAAPSAAPPADDAPSTPAGPADDAPAPPPGTAAPAAPAAPQPPAPPAPPTPAPTVPPPAAPAEGGAVGDILSDVLDLVGGSLGLGG